MKNSRALLASIFSRTPVFKGKGRLVLWIDRLLSGQDSANSFMATGNINGLAQMHFDLRPWGQKFAYYYGEWESEYITLARSLYRGGAFIDVGSSIGLYVICFGDLVRKSGSIIASVEPVAFNLVKQKENVELNHYNDVVRYFPVALGEQESSLMLSADPDGRDNNAFVSDVGTIEVTVTTLDKLVANEAIGKVGFIKIDVEGYEPMVVAGGKETIARDRPLIFAEFNRERMEINGFQMNPSWHFLKGEDYVAYRVVGGKLAPLAEPGETENIFFVPPHVVVPKALLA